MQAKAASIGGRFGCAQSLLVKAMNWQGPIDEASPSKKKEEMAAQAVDVYWMAQQVANSPEGEAHLGTAPR